MAEKRGKQVYTTTQLDYVTRVLNSRNYYTALDLGSSASTDDVKRSYKYLALQIHPDKNSAPDSEKAFQILGQAYETLKDQEKRFMYNIQLFNEFASAKQGTIVLTSDLKKRRWEYSYNPEPFKTENHNDDKDKNSKEMPESTTYTTNNSKTQSESSRNDPKRNKFGTRNGLWQYQEYWTENVRRNLFMILVGLIILVLGICYYYYTAPGFSLVESRLYSVKMITKKSGIVFYVTPFYHPRDEDERKQLFSDVKIAAKKRFSFIL